MKKKYYILESKAYEFLWFVNPKAASRSVRNFFTNIGEEFPAETLKPFNEKRYKDHFKFAFVRNPWSRILSAWKNKTNNPKDKPSWRIYGKYKNLSFGEFIRDIRCDKIQTLDNFEGGMVERHIRPQFELLPVNKLDFIGRCETFSEDFNTIRKRIGLPCGKIPEANKTKHKHYTEYYDDETKQIVAEKYAKDIEHFGYEFGEDR